MPAPRPILLLTRPQISSEHFLQALRNRGIAHRALISPLMDIVFTEDAIDLEGVRGLIFTSANGIAAWRARNLPTTLPVHVVGPATEIAARAAGFDVRLTCPDAARLIPALERAHAAGEIDGPLLHLSGLHTRGDVAGQLTARGLPTARVTVYDQPQMPLSRDARAALDGTNPVLCPLFSPRTAQLLAESPVKAPLLVAAMSEAVVNALWPLHIESLKVAARPDSGAMVEAVRDLLTDIAAEGEGRRERTPEHGSGTG